MANDITPGSSKADMLRKIENQRIEIVHLLNAANAYVSMTVDRGVVIRAAIKHLKHHRTTSAMSTLQGYVKRANSIQCLRELAENPNEHT